MTESPGSGSPEQDIKDNSLAQFLNRRADMLEAWAGKEASKEDIANAAVLTATGVMGIGAAIKYGPSLTHQARDVAEFAGTAIEYIASGAKDAQNIGELANQIISRTTDVASGVALGTYLRAGEEIIDTMTAGQTENAAHLGAGFLIGATGVGSGLGLGVVTEIRGKVKPDKPLLRSTHVVPAIAKSLRMLSSISERGKS
ncbi:hypothetical protein JXA63_02245 [Candidatus Woesebacteria bacterium]|nr:hypothetical protein [Candidatus Woesebacteria bacterium]